MGGANPQPQDGFQQWKSKYAPHDTGTDYDLRGAYEAGLQPDPERGHFPDTFKMTNHPTFSVESKYSTPEHPGGVWGTDANGRDTFTPSTWMASDANRMKTLKEYFSKAEPNATLILPKLNTNPITTPMGGSNTQQTDTAQMLPHMPLDTSLPMKKEIYQPSWDQIPDPKGPKHLMTPEESYKANQEARKGMKEKRTKNPSFNDQTPVNGTTSMSPNSYGRDAQPLNSFDAIEHGLKEAETA